MTQPPARRLTVLRGSDLQGVVRQPAVVLRDAPASPPKPDAPDAGPGAVQSPYGVPASAVQHCCGRGCRHCRIYWHRGEQ